MTHLNNLIIVGRLTRDPEVKETQYGKACRLNIASEHEGKSFKDKPGKKEVLFISGTLWGPKVENAIHLKKGQEVFVSGRLKMEEKVNEQTKEKRHYWSIAIETIMYNLKLEEFVGKSFTESTQEDDGELPF